MDRINELVKILNEASKAYYQKDMEIMDNIEYDALYDELVKLEEETGIVLDDSPTKSVGFTVLSQLVKVRHSSRMLSLDKTKDEEKLVDFLGENEGVLSWKLDGLTIVATYENGKFISAVTRGNGEIGEDVTHNAMHFNHLPNEIDFKGNLVIRGEAVISYSSFNKINEELAEEDKYKNPRNLCSGTVRQLDSKISAKRDVEFYGFTVSSNDEEIGSLKSQSLDFIEKLGFKKVAYKIVNKDNVVEAVREFKNNVQTFDIPSDGLVLTLNDIELSKSLGETSKFPKDSIAFKWKDEIKETKLIDILWNTSRTGLINPIAVFEDVDLEGTTVNRASLHNVSIAEALELGIGDTIRVYKANMIIPQVESNLTKSNSFVVPDQCSVCGFETIIEEKNGVKCLYCKNPNCGAQKLKSLTHFTSRDAMNIEGLSEATLERFIDENIVNNYMDIFSIKDHGETIKTLKGFGEKSYNKLVDAVEKSKNVTLPSFIYALGISNIGLANAKLLNKHFKGDIEKIIHANQEELVIIDGFGEIMANEVVKYFSNEENLSLLTKALAILNIEKFEDNAPSNSIDKTFALTGDVNVFKNRRELTEYIESIGGKVSSSVTGKTDYLVNNDKFSSSSKNKKANELNIPIISEEEFVELFGKN